MFMFDWYRDLHPGTRIVLGFAALIAVGTVFLLLPISTPPDRDLSFTDAVFTATSAVCVTGLIVVQTPHHFTWFGELVVMLLFQMGGIGIVLGSTAVLLGIRGSMSMDQQFALQESFMNWPYEKVQSAFVRVFAFFFSLEAIGAVVFTWRFQGEMAFPRALWHGVFHSISAVCNAGFSLNPDSLVGYQDDPFVVLTAVLLIVCGGIGFIVLADLFERIRGKERLTLHSRTMLYGTLLLIVAGAGTFMALEPEVGPLGWIFQSVTARTAGFNTVDIAAWGTPSLLILMMLMFVGAGPSSTAGGIKITTLVAALADMASRVQQRKNVHWLNRRLPRELVNNSVVLAAMALFAAGFSTFLLSITESAGLQVVMFEVFSALGTVGLSLGITMDLSLPGKWVIIGLMFLGRLGPLTFALLIIESAETEFTYPEERLMIG